MAKKSASPFATVGDTLAFPNLAMSLKPQRRIAAAGSLILSEKRRTLSWREEMFTTARSKIQGDPFSFFFFYLVAVIKLERNI